MHSDRTKTKFGATVGALCIVVVVASLSRFDVACNLNGKRIVISFRNKLSRWVTADGCLAETLSNPVRLCFMSIVSKTSQCVYIDRSIDSRKCELARESYSLSAEPIIRFRVIDTVSNICQPIFIHTCIGNNVLLYALIITNMPTLIVPSFRQYMHNKSQSTLIHSPLSTRTDEPYQ